MSKRFLNAQNLCEYLMFHHFGAIVMFTILCLIFNFFAFTVILYILLIALSINIGCNLILTSIWMINEYSNYIKTIYDQINKENNSSL